MSLSCAKWVISVLVDCQKTWNSITNLWTAMANNSRKNHWRFALELITSISVRQIQLSRLPNAYLMKNHSHLCYRLSACDLSVSRDCQGKNAVLDLFILLLESVSENGSERENTLWWLIDVKFFFNNFLIDKTHKRLQNIIKQIHFNKSNDHIGITKEKNY